MKPIALPLFAAVSAFLLAGTAPQLSAATSPRYGGTLRVELHEAALSLDPREWKAGAPESATNEKIAALLFDRLVALDNFGRFQPRLAADWSHDASFKKWQFLLRSDVKFSDGALLTAADAVAALQPLLPEGQQISSSGSNVLIQSSEAAPDLLEELASGRFFVYRILPDGTLVGTGPFFVAAPVQPTRSTSDAPHSPNDPHAFSASSAGRTNHLQFRANEDCWSGRPFLDSIDVTLGVPPLRQLFDLQLGKADLVELSPELVRRAAQENLRIWSSAPVLLYGLRFDEAQQAAADPKLREALSLSLDRPTMASVLLQKQAVPASALLPQWLSGYAFLFNMETNLGRAKEIRAALPIDEAGGREPLRLSVDAPGDLPRLLGERVAVNARQASILVQVANRTPSHSTAGAASNVPPTGLHLFAWSYSEFSPRAALGAFIASLRLGEPSGTASLSDDPQQLFAREHQLLDDRRVLPLVMLPEYVGLGQNLRDWMPSPWGEWHLAGVWLDLPPSPAVQPGSSDGTNSPVTPAPASTPGAKP